MTLFAIPEGGIAPATADTVENAPPAESAPAPQTAAPTGKPTAESVQVPKPDGLLPHDRGHIQEDYLDPLALPLSLPTDQLLQQVKELTALPDLSPVTDLDPGALLDTDLSLPALPLGQLKGVVDGVVARALDTVDGVRRTAAAVAGGVVKAGQAAASAKTTPTSTPTLTLAAAAPEPPSATWVLTTSAGGVNQTFTLPLCAPSPVNVAGTNQLTPTTIVSLCPVPLAMTSTKIVPSPGQPVQLYLSIEKIATAAAFPASFEATYRYSDPTTGTAIDTYFGLSSTSTNYPSEAIVGALTQASSADTNATMSWALNGKADRVYVGARNIGSIEIQRAVGGAGNMNVSFANGRLSSQFKSRDPIPAGANPAVILTAAIPNTAGNPSAQLSWTSIPQEFVFDLTPRHSNGQVAGIEFSGSQTPSANPSFTTQLDLLMQGALAGRFRQAGFGAQFSETLNLTQDNNGNVNGAAVQATPGAASTLTISSYKNGVLGAFIELVGMRANASEQNVTFEGAAGTAGAGVTVSATNAADLVGVGSYYATDGTGAVLPSLQASMLLTTSVGLGLAPPFAVPDGALAAIKVRDVASDYKIKIAAIASGDASAANTVSGLEVTGSTTTSRTATQLTVDAQTSLSQRAFLLFNQMGQDWKFKINLHGTAGTPTGVDVSDVNTPATANEFKQLIVYTNTQPTYGMEIRRPSSDLSGARTLAGTTAVLNDPPASFDLTIDHAMPNVQGMHCSEGLTLSGTDTAASPGSLTLVSGITTLTLERVFVNGKWRAQAVGTGPATTCKPDAFHFEVSQELGPNPNGRLVVNNVNAAFTLQSFASQTVVNVSLVMDGGGKPTGARVDGTNAEANPGMQILADVLNGAERTVGLNMWAGPTGTVHDGTQATIVVGNVPQAFGFVIDRHTDPATKEQEVHVGSDQTTAAPAEFVRIAAPVPTQVAPGGSLTLVIRSLGMQTNLNIKFVVSGGSTKVRIHGTNDAPNTTEVISAAIRDAGGTPLFSILFDRPSGDIGGLPTSGSQATIRWQRVPANFELGLTVHGADPGPPGLEMSIAGADPAPTSELRLTQTTENMSLVFRGTGSAQTFNATQSDVSSHVDASIPPELASIQVFKIFPEGPNKWKDTIFTIFRSGELAQPSTQSGTEIRVTPMGAKTLGLTYINNKPTITGDWSASSAGSFIDFYQYHQSDNHQRCTSGGWPVACTSISLTDVPMTAHLRMTPPSKTHLLPVVEYTGTDSNLGLYIQALLPGVGGTLYMTGVPAHGFYLEGSLDLSGTDAHLALGANDLNERLPSFYLDGWNVEIPVKIEPKHGTKDGLKYNLALDYDISIIMRYIGYVALQGDAGLQDVKLIPVLATEDQKSVFGGLIGIDTEGNVGSAFRLGLTLAVDTRDVSGQVAWSWKLYEPLVFGLGATIAQDSDRFVWPISPIPQYGTGWIELDSWQVFPGFPGKFQGTGCARSDTADEVTKDDTRDGSFTPPFDPAFGDVYNGFVSCAGTTTYYQLNPQGLLTEHCVYNPAPCPDGENVAANNRYSWAHVPAVNQNTDWFLALVLKHLYSDDPAKFLAEPCRSQC